MTLMNLLKRSLCIVLFDHGFISFGLLSFFVISAGIVSAQRPAFSNVPAPERELSRNITPPWDMPELFGIPQIHPAECCKLEGFESFFYEGLEYKANKTRVFAYYKSPTGSPPPGGWPAVVCVHGGGGTAFPEWVQAWVDHGYAAIAMDLEGHLPKGKFPDREWHEYAGPARITTFGDIELADREQWFFHAVADVIKANSLLRSFPEINSNKIGVHGISWGGVVTSAVMGIDHRLAFAIPVYGCGFIYESSNPKKRIYFDAMTKKQFAVYKSKWDPSIYLPDCKIPNLFYLGTNDPAYPLDIWQKSASIVKGPTMLCIPVTNKHGHIWDQKEIFAFADAVVMNGKPLLKIGKPELLDGKATVKISGDRNAMSSVSSARLIHTKDSCHWQERQWQTIPATFDGTRAWVEVPAGTRAFYFNITDKEGLTFSSPYTEPRRASVWKD